MSQPIQDIHNFFTRNVKVTHTDPKHFLCLLCPSRCLEMNVFFFFFSFLLLKQIFLSLLFTQIVLFYHINKLIFDIFCDHYLSECLEHDLKLTVCFLLISGIRWNDLVLKQIIVYCSGEMDYYFKITIIFLMSLKKSCSINMDCFAWAFTVSLQQITVFKIS